MLQEGSVLGSYVIEGYIASGGMGVVYRAQHVVFRRTVALKVLQELYARNPKIRQRFQQEAMIQANLQHPNIVRVTDFLEVEPYVALAMDFVAGPSLEEVLAEERTGAWPAHEWLPIFTQIVSAVAYAHEAGVVHRDIKPANVLLDRAAGRPGIPRITDFGIAKIVTGAVPAATRAGSRMGTVPFMAPEQFRGEVDVGPSADVYALGMLAWRLAAGALPIDADDGVAAAELYTGRRKVPAFASVAPGLPADVAQALDACLALRPASRPADAGALLAALTRTRAGGVPASAMPAPTAASSEGGTHTRLDAGKKPGALKWTWRALAATAALAVGLAAWVQHARSVEEEVAAGDATPSLATQAAMSLEISPSDRRKPEPPRALPTVQAVPKPATIEQPPPGPAPPAVAPARPTIPAAAVPAADAPSAADKVVTDSSAFVRIEPGSFTMGSPRSEKGRFRDETQHEVTLTRAFYLKRTEVTQAEWRALMGNNPSARGGCDTCPVERVNWYDAVAFVNALSKQDGLAECYDARCSGVPGQEGFACHSVAFAGLSCPGYRLPTEAEWEYAARAGSYVEFPSIEMNSVAWCADNSQGRAHPVALKRANAWGLSDMVGNAWEWCQDGYGQYGTSSQIDPKGVNRARNRVFRGGSWGDSAEYQRVTFRRWIKPAVHYASMGFRPARTIPPPSP